MVGLMRRWCRERTALCKRVAFAACPGLDRSGFLLRSLLAPSGLVV